MIWLVLYILLVIVDGQDLVPEILSDPDDFIGFPDKFKALSVKINTVQDAKCYWLKDDKKITKDSQPPFRSVDSRTLIADSKSKENAGIYQFVMTTKAGTIKGRKIKVEFTYLGAFDPNLPTTRTVNVVLGQANFIKCPKHELGSHEFYKWGRTLKLGGKKFLEIKPNLFVMNDGTLFYSHLTDEDASNFNQHKWVCGMEGVVGEEHRLKWSTNVKTVLKPVNKNMTAFGPKIVTSLPHNKQFQEGDTLSMKCAATGRPNPLYSWRRIGVDGKEHTIENGKDGFRFSEGDARFLVLYSAKEEHTGQYFCTATIGNNSDTVEGSLTFEVEPKWVVKDVKSVKPSIYSSHSWTCNATGVPVPIYQWYKNGVPLNSSAKHNISEGTITFPRLEKNDTAMYECVADNGVNNIYQTAYLDVQAEKPVFDMNTSKETLFLDSKGVIKCHAKAAPAARNTWKKDGVKIDFSLPLYTLVNNEDLVIESVSKQDSGNYTCIAENNFGVDIKEINVHVIDEIAFISEPQDVIVKVGDSPKLKCQAKVNRNSSDNEKIKYKWKYNDQDIKLSDAIVWSDDNHSLVFRNPQVDHSGNYTCIAYIDQPSYVEKRSSAKVVIRGPPQAPDKIEIEEHCRNFSARLMWNASRKNYDPIKYFIIETATNNDTEWRKNKSDQIDPKLNEKTIKGLSPWTKYRFRVLAFNEIGKSDPSEPTRLILCETPSQAEIAALYKRSWFIVIVVVVCFLLIILLIALIISFVTREKGKRYPVGKLERTRAATLDVGEEEPDYNTYPKKPSSLRKDPDRDSLDEYGEDRFAEDVASLIGAYSKGNLN